MRLKPSAPPSHVSQQMLHCQPLKESPCRLIRWTGRSSYDRRVLASSVPKKLNHKISRRHGFYAFTTAFAQMLLPSLQQRSAHAASLEERDCVEFSKAGPFQIAQLPRLEHTCTECYPLCVGDRCLIRLQVTYPKTTPEKLQAPYPLAIISGGFLVKGAEYTSYAERLASWGYVAVLYDKVETLMESLDDVLSMNVIREIIDWAQTNPLMKKLTNSNFVYLIGHSRGGKLSVLAASEDPRIQSLCLIDPVDNTIYAPLGPGYPSAVAALKSRSVSIPLLSIGSELGADCAPIEANFRQFYEAAPGSAVEVIIRDSGHFQFLDNPSTLDRAICVQGKTDDRDVRGITQSLMVAWGETTVKPFLPEAKYIPYGTTVRSTARRSVIPSANRPETKAQSNALHRSFSALLRNTAHIMERTKNLILF